MKFFSVCKYFKKPHFTFKALFWFLLPLWGLGGLVFIIQKSILLDESIYQNTNFLLVNACKSLRFLGVFLVGLASGIYFWGWKWNLLFEKFWEKSIFLMAILVLGITFCFSPYNFYFENLFIFDRILLGILVILCFFKPSFLFLFVFYCYFFAIQFSYPFGGQSYEWTFNVWCDVLLMLWCWFLLPHPLPLSEGEGSNKKSHILMFVYTYVLSIYSYPAIQKMLLGEYFGQWIFENNLFNYFVAGDVQYWEFLESNFNFWQILFENTNVFFTFSVFFIEIGILAFWHKRYFQVLAFGRFSLHFSVFFFTGNTFWSWQLLNLVLFFQIIFLEKEILDKIFNKIHLAFLLNILVLLMPFCLPIKSLAWWDSNFYQVYTLEAVDDKGNTYVLTPSDYAPYTIWGRKAQFYYLNDEKYLTGTYGSVKDYALYKALRNAKNAEDIKNIKLKFGRNLFNQKEKDKFIHFTKKLLFYLKSKNNSIPTFVPLHFYTFLKEKNQKINLKNIQKINIKYKEILYSNHKKNKILEKVVLEVNL